jgi:hypothetical protein
MKKLLTIFYLLVTGLAFGQGFTYSYVDPCSKKLKTIYLGTNESITVNYLGVIGTFTQQDFSNGTFSNWVQTAQSQAASQPCDELKTQTQVLQNTIITQNIISTLTSITAASSMNIANSLGGASNALGNSVDNSSSSSGSRNKRNNSNIGNNTQNQTGSPGNQTGGQNSGSTNTQSGGSSSGSGEGNGSQGENTPDPNKPAEGGGGSPQQSVGSAGQNPSSSGQSGSGQGGQSSGGNSGGSGSGSNSGSGGNTQSGTSNSQGQPQGQNVPENNKQTESGGGNGGTTNSVSNAAESSSSNSGGSKVRVGSVIGTGDIVAIRSAEDQSNQFKGTMSVTKSNTNNTRAKGFLLNFTTTINNSNLTFYGAFSNKSKTNTLIIANSSMLDFDRNFFNTTTALESKRFGKLSLMAGLNFTAGFLAEESFSNLSGVGGGFYPFKVSKNLSGTILMLGVYSPYTKFYEGKWWDSGILLVPFSSWDYSISKNFKYNVSFSGTYQIKGSVLNYQILTGGKILL